MTLVPLHCYVDHFERDVFSKRNTRNWTPYRWLIKLVFSFVTLTKLTKHTSNLTITFYCTKPQEFILRRWSIANQLFACISCEYWLFWISTAASVSIAIRTCHAFFFAYIALTAMNKKTNVLPCHRNAKTCQMTKKLCHMAAESSRSFNRASTCACVGTYYYYSTRMHMHIGREMVCAWGHYYIYSRVALCQCVTLCPVTFRCVSQFVQFFSDKHSVKAAITCCFFLPLHNLHSENTLRD